MKIAVACEGTQVAQHFGHCDYFHLFDTEGARIVGDVQVPNPGHRPGFLPVFLHEQGVEAIISGGMGGGAVAIFTEKGIDVYMGVSGSPRVAAESLAAGTLVSSGSVCHEHQHHDTCH